MGLFTTVLRDIFFSNLISWSYLQGHGLKLFWGMGHFFYSSNLFIRHGPKLFWMTDLFITLITWVIYNGLINRFQRNRYFLLFKNLELWIIIDLFKIVLMGRLFCCCNLWSNLQSLDLRWFWWTNLFIAVLYIFTVPWSKINVFNGNWSGIDLFIALF